MTQPLNKMPTTEDAQEKLDYALVEAVLEKKLDEARALIERGANANATIPMAMQTHTGQWMFRSKTQEIFPHHRHDIVEYDMPVLGLATYTKGVEMARLLLEKKADPTQPFFRAQYYFTGPDSNAHHFTYADRDDTAFTPRSCSRITSPLKVVKNITLICAEDKRPEFAERIKTYEDIERLMEEAMQPQGPPLPKKKAPPPLNKMPSTDDAQEKLDYALVEAVLERNLGKAKALIGQGANVNATIPMAVHMSNRTGWQFYSKDAQDVTHHRHETLQYDTPVLCLALNPPNVEMVRLLFEHKANPLQQFFRAQYRDKHGDNRGRFTYADRDRPALYPPAFGPRISWPLKAMQNVVTHEAKEADALSEIQRLAEEAMESQGLTEPSSLPKLEKRGRGRPSKDASVVLS